LQARKSGPLAQHYLLKVVKARLEEEKRALAEAKKTGPQAGLVKTESALNSYKENLKLRMASRKAPGNFTVIARFHH
jgi:hypothetical protein